MKPNKMKKFLPKESPKAIAERLKTLSKFEKYIIRKAAAEKAQQN